MPNTENGHSRGEEASWPRELDAAGATTGVSVLRGAAWGLAGQVLPQFYLIALSIAAARFLGPTRFGRQSFIAFVEITVISLLSAGVPHTVARFVADALGRRDSAFALRITRWAWRIAIGGAIGGTALLIGVGIAGGSPRAAWFLAAAAAGAGILARVPAAFLTGIQQWRAQTLVGLTLGAVGAVVAIAVLAAGFGITGMFAVEAATGAVSLILLSVFASRASARFGRDVHAAPISRELVGDVARYAGLVSINVIFTLVIWRRSELFFLQHFSPVREMGYYSIAFAAATAPVLAIQGLIGVLMPALATLHGAGSIDRIRSGFSRSLRLLLVISFPITAFAVALGPTLIKLVYGDRYARVGPILVILLAVLPLVPLTTLSNALLAATARLRFVVFLNVVVSGVNILLDLLLIPRYDAVGAAVASATAQMIIGLLIVLYASKVLGGIRWEYPVIVRAAVTSVLAGLTASACVTAENGVVGFAAGLVAGAFVFAVLANRLKIVYYADGEWLAGAVGSRLRGLAGRSIALIAQPPRQIENP